MTLVSGAQDAKGGKRMTDSAYRAKQVLQEYRQLEKRVQEKTERLAALMASATRTTPSLEAERVSGSGNKSRIESAVITFVELEQQLDKSIDAKNAQRHAIQNAIDAMKDEREARLLELRYIDGRSWVNVMMRMEIGETWSKTIHASALEHFAEIFF